ncbi:MAG: sigma factor, partial [Acidobacteriota bacterium]
MAAQARACQLVPGAGDGSTMAVVSSEPPVMDEHAFHGLYARMARPLRAYLSRVTGNLAVADDLLQESYYRFLRAEFRSRDEGSMKARCEHEDAVVLAL